MKQCNICKKKYLKARVYSYADNSSIKRKYPNVHKKKFTITLDVLNYLIKNISYLKKNKKEIFLKYNCKIKRLNLKICNRCSKTIKKRIINFYHLKNKIL